MVLTAASVCHVLGSGGRRGAIKTLLISIFVHLKVNHPWAQSYDGVLNMLCYMSFYTVLYPLPSFFLHPERVNVNDFFQYEYSGPWKIAVINGCHGNTHSCQGKKNRYIPPLAFNTLHLANSVEMFSFKTPLFSMFNRTSN
jgi:hypothetical protein